jgi:hypothetical protein
VGAQTERMQSITLRLAKAGDAAALERVAQRDSAPLPPAPHLVALREGRIDAASSLATGVVVADPFRPTADLCELLRVGAARHRVSRPGRLVPRTGPRPAVATA